MEVTRAGEALRADPSFAENIRSASGQPIELCYQCQKCAAGCLPMAGFNDTTPNQLIRMISLGLKDQVLKNPAIWLCTGCETCGARCPNGISVAEVMDAAREMAQVENTLAGDRTPVFHRMFLNEIRAWGRISESMLMAKYKIRTGQLFSDLDLGLRLFLKGKLPLVPKGIKDKRSVRVIFDRAEEKVRRRHREACRGGRNT
jgi:heterodisulfide reductase subunit C